MTFTRVRAALIVIFLLTLGAALSLVILDYGSHAIRDADMRILITSLFAIYSVHLAIIAGGLFGANKQSEQVQARLSMSFALTTATIWNLLILVRTIMFVADSHDSWLALKSFYELAASSGSFLVAGSLAYFFAARE